ncbi:hypothetical protein ABTK35_20335, partial [Acinetobacter baumannii]
SVMCAIIFAYSMAIRALIFYAQLEYSYGIFVGYLFVLAISSIFALTLVMRMWPHTVPKELIEKAVDWVKKAHDRTATRLIKE